MTILVKIALFSKAISRPRIIIWPWIFTLIHRHHVWALYGWYFCVFTPASRVSQHKNVIFCHFQSYSLVDMVMFIADVIHALLICYFFVHKFNKYNVSLLDFAVLLSNFAAISRFLTYICNILVILNIWWSYFVNINCMHDAFKQLYACLSMIVALFCRVWCIFMLVFHILMQYKGP